MVGDMAVDFSGDMGEMALYLAKFRAGQRAVRAAAQFRAGQGRAKGAAPFTTEQGQTQRGRIALGFCLTALYPTKKKNAA
jgi:hypothetical protein